MTVMKSGAGYVVELPHRRDPIVHDQQMAAGRRRTGHHRDEPAALQQDSSAHRHILAHIGAG